MERLAIVHLPLFANDLFFHSMYGYEKLSALYHFTLDMLSTNGQLDLKSFLGKSLSVQVRQIDAPDRWFNGEITAIMLKGKESSLSCYYVYQVEVHPKLWYLTKHVDFRIFQQQCVPDIIKQILSEYNITIEDRLLASYPQWEYCIQYQETAFDFISRLMEHEGIYYFFEHQKNSHALVLADNSQTHQFINGISTLSYREPGAATLLTEALYVDQWQVFDTLPSRFFIMNDDVEKPSAIVAKVKENVASYPAEYNQVQEQSQCQRMQGSTACCNLSPGGKLVLIKAPRSTDNREYFLVESHYSVWDNSDVNGEYASRGQRCDFIVIPAEIIWRSPHITPWPKIYGPQIARVVCPPGENLWTDNLGRVNVKFAWDHYDTDDKSSCWVSVASTWKGAEGQKEGLPHLNDEVIIEFINGNPDRPIIMGRL